MEGLRSRLRMSTQRQTDSQPQQENEEVFELSDTEVDFELELDVENNYEDEDEVLIIEDSDPERYDEDDEERARGNNITDDSDIQEIPFPERGIVEVQLEDEDQGGQERREAENRNENENPEGNAESVVVDENEDADDEEEGGRGPEEEGPPQKMPRLDTSLDDDDGVSCIICSEPYTNAGVHRCCCLKCGHIFGKECIEKWIHTAKTCPSCKCKATKKDIRVLYGRTVRMIDTSEMERLRKENETIKIERNKSELSNARLRTQLDMEKTAKAMLEEQLRQLKLRIEPSAESDPKPGTSASARLIAEASSSSSGQGLYGGLRMPKVKHLKHFDVKEGQCRVGVYSPEKSLFIVSHAIRNPLYPNFYGIKLIRTVDMKTFQTYPIHQRGLRDMAFSLEQPDLLLTVGLDKKAVLFNTYSNCNVQTFNTGFPLWSCCWNAVKQNVFYLGTNNGQIISYDIRSPGQPLNNLIVPSQDKSAIGRLKYVPPTYQTQNFNMSGLMIQKLNSVWFCELMGGEETDPRYHQFPLEGPFLNVDFEEVSRHVLVSARPKQDRGSSHIVCSLGKQYSETEERHIFNCDVVQCITGGFQEASVLCRSSLFSPKDGQVFVAANGEGVKTVRVWDIANIEQKTLLPIIDKAALDFVPGKVNDTSFLGVISEKAVNFYDTTQ